MPANTLPINELIMLLALDEEGGRVSWRVSPYLDYALAGAMLAELALRGVIEVTADGDLRLKEVPATTGSKLLDEVLQVFRRSRHPHTVSGWVAAVSAIEDLDHRQMEELAAKKILEKREGHFLLIFPVTTYPASDRTVEKEVVAQIREALLGEGEVEPRLSILITIARGAHLLRGPLTDEELERAEKRLADIARGHAISTATCKLIQEAERALFVASSIPFMGISRV